MHATEKLTPTIGDAVTIDGQPGVHLVILTGADLATDSPAHAGWIRVQQIWDGAGPSHQSSTVHVDATALVLGGYIDAQPDGDPPATAGCRLTAGRGSDIVIPRNAAAHASDDEILDAARMLQAAAGLKPDARLVERIPTGWRPAEADR
ncbi:hypothetical protein [Nonomuraea recticatena]